MLREDINSFTDGVATDEHDVATVVGYAGDAVIFQDDQRNIYYLPAELPDLFELGTVARISELDPLDAAGPQLKDEILSVVKEGKD